MKTRLALGLAGIAMAAAGFTGIALGDDDDEGFFRRSWGAAAPPGVAVVDNRLYREECGSCHMAYPPGLLPAPSWERLMAALDDHFGENAELPERERTIILNYLLDAAAGRSNYRVSNKMLRGMKEPPLRISELPYFRHEHREIPQRLVSGNSRVRSLSNCDACHTRADQGSFSEHEIHIPGYGRYQD
ncbi:diheme cytochrome c [Thiohalobacter sp. IOR34]|uniref:diheme cytochrome c n=1 Tax=Thiohalobacter sp. IOR34 TaxID=3057176 RepID=UPI0025B033D9|nr:diheme cytochrome c [Thiohalobacter sp. IOR34]WJW74300.1 diheme cytochrome c [Thiohalobacter sp. IOR34]